MISLLDYVAVRCSVKLQICMIIGVEIGYILDEVIPILSQHLNRFIYEMYI